jgi:hypothetical protein
MARPKGILFNEETAGSNYAEFTIARKPDGKIKMQRMLFILLYAIVAVAYIFVFTVLTKMIPLVAILPLIILIMWFFTWKLTKIEYTYVVYQGMLHVYKNNGYNKAKEIFSAKLSENGGVYPVSDEEYAKFADDCQASLDYSIGKNTEDRYFAIFTVDGKKTAVYFTAATKLLTAMRYYGGENVIVTYVSR